MEPRERVSALGPDWVSGQAAVVLERRLEPVVSALLWVRALAVQRSALAP
jgi:hypothetical protein